MKPLPIQPLLPKGHLQTPLRRAIVSFVRANPGATFAQIEEAIQHLPTPCGPDLLRYHLRQLVNRDHLHMVGERGKKGQRWHHGPKPASPAPPNATPPRQVQVMFGPVYVPPSAPVLRAGALDASRLPSRGHAC